jgi:tetratricopeptide (TPR) repeat protein
MMAFGWGRSGSEKIVEAFGSSWQDQIGEPDDLLRLGFALYDTHGYDEAVQVFRKLEEIAFAQGDQGEAAMALIWQGQMLDLLGRRDAAVSCYQRVVDMRSSDGVRHDQYGLSYQYSAYAAERLRTPFQRIENQLP